MTPLGFDEGHGVGWRHPGCNEIPCHNTRAARNALNAMYENTRVRVAEGLRDERCGGRKMSCELCKRVVLERQLEVVGCRESERKGDIARHRRHDMCNPEGGQSVDVLGSRDVCEPETRYDLGRRERRGMVRGEAGRARRWRTREVGGVDGGEGRELGGYWRPGVLSLHNQWGTKKRRFLWDERSLREDRRPEWESARVCEGWSRGMRVKGPEMDEDAAWMDGRGDWKEYEGPTIVNKLFMIRRGAATQPKRVFGKDDPIETGNKVERSGLVNGRSWCRSLLYEQGRMVSRR